MPHFVTASFPSVEYPCESGGYRFAHLLENPHHLDEWLIKVEYQHCEALLRVKKRPSEGDYLVRFDKSANFFSTPITHRALRLFAELTHSELLTHNFVLDSSSALGDEPKEEWSPFFKRPSFFLDPLPLANCWLEIGFGSGRHLLHQAKAHPDKLFVGLEIHTPSIAQVLRRLELEGLKNVLIVAYDARLFLEILPSNSVERIFLHFPVPWEKKPHRRVVSEAFLDEAIRVLAVSGSFELRTDSPDYFAFTLEQMLRLEQAHFLVRKNSEIAVSSKYEDRWKRQQKSIYDLLLTNQIFSPTLASKETFDFEGVIPDIEKLVLFRRIETGWFLNVDRIYRSRAGDTAAIRISFGDFAYPEKRYVWVEAGRILYFDQKPTPTLANQKAHQALREYFSE